MGWPAWPRTVVTMPTVSISFPYNEPGANSPELETHRERRREVSERLSADQRCRGTAHCKDFNTQTIDKQQPAYIFQKYQSIFQCDKTCWLCCVWKVWLPEEKVWIHFVCSISVELDLISLGTTLCLVVEYQMLADRHAKLKWWTSFIELLTWLCITCQFSIFRMYNNNLLFYKQHV